MNIRQIWSLALLVTTANLLPGSAHACIVPAEIKLTDVSYADVVVVARVQKYRIIRDEAFRREMLAFPGLSKGERKMYKDPNQSLISDYALFDLQVEQVLKGSVPTRISVGWDNSTFGEPSKIGSGPFLIALRRHRSPTPPLRGPSATILPAPDGSEFELLQAPCSSAFIFEADSDDSNTIQKILASGR